MLPSGRVSGILLPLFSLRSHGDFGIGDFGSVDGLFTWMQAARQKLWMLLPLLPTAPNDPSPYGTRSAFGLNPLNIDLRAVPEFEEIGGVVALLPPDRAALEEAHRSPRIRYDLVFGLKKRALRLAFQAFEKKGSGSERGRAFNAWVREEKSWVEDFALFAAISADRNHLPWWEWPGPLQDREPHALAAESERLRDEVRFHAWQQWTAEQQWDEVRRKAQAHGVLLCGDEPFIVGQDSADAWANPRILRRDARLGVPPDDFSATGQDWGLPYFDFAEMEKDGYAWLKARARKAASYYDLRRVDHAVGYFRQWIRDTQTPTGRFIPPDEPSHRRLGERNFRLLSDGAGIVAEDLGVIPPFVREKLAEMQLPGYRVMRWERDDGRYRDPRHYPGSSLATTGTHDTDTLREWWEGAPDWEREAVARVYPELQSMQPPPRELTPPVHQALLAAAENSGSSLVVLPWQDVLGIRERVNLPGSTGEANWSYRLPQSSDQLMTDPQTRAGAELLAQLTQAAGR